MVETAVYLDDILKILGWSRAKFFQKHWKNELVKLGVVFYRIERRKCSDGKTRRYKRILAFESRIQRYIVLKSRKGEFL
jgi:hypothetical protein